MAENPLSPEAGPAGAVCGGCVWHYRGGRGRAVERCRRHGKQRVGAEVPACAGFSAQLDCMSCGACCREAYQAVEVGPRDPFVKLHPERLERLDGRLNIRREAGICACLAPKVGTWPCVVYADRPKTCRDFEKGSDNCLFARQQLGVAP
jgi:hypothetical protein